MCRSEMNIALTHPYPHDTLYLLEVFLRMGGRVLRDTPESRLSLTVGQLGRDGEGVGV
jgi:hypothetical protein